MARKCAHRDGMHFCLDESMMFLVQNVDDPSLLVVAVRGTNPLCFSDWVDGDLDIASPVLWPFDSDGLSKISGSTCFGLNNLLSLSSKSENQQPTKLESGFLTGYHKTAKQLGNMARVLPQVKLSPLLKGIQMFLDKLPQTSKISLSLPSSPSPVEILKQLSKKRITEVKTWEQVIHEQKSKPGQGLVEFLSQNLHQEERRVIFAGHSKGGALAPALALWLEETRAHWDPSDRVSIGCCSFASPTAGNSEFVSRLHKMLSDEVISVLNEDDLVTHAWDSKSFSEIPIMYNSRLKKLQKMVDEVVENILKDVGYSRHGVAVHSFKGTSLPSTPVDQGISSQIIYQHLDAYLDYFGLLSHVDAVGLFQ